MKTTAGVISNIIILHSCIKKYCYVRMLIANKKKVELQVTSCLQKSRIDFLERSL